MAVNVSENARSVFVRVHFGFCDFNICNKKKRKKKEAVNEKNIAVILSDRHGKDL